MARYSGIDGRKNEEETNRVSDRFFLLTLPDDRAVGPVGRGFL
jgi:hypothetical protein